MNSAPDNDNLKKQVSELAEKLKGIEDRIAEQEQAARETEDEIFRINQPQPRKYVLRRVELVPVHGALMLDGQPISGARIVFMSASGMIGAARTDDNGRYLVRMGGQKGLPPGSYRVSIRSNKSNSAPEDAVLTPKKYGAPETSGLMIDVHASDTNVFDFELKSR